MSKKQKDFVILFITPLILGIAIFHWNSISWVFNYRVMTTLVYNFFNPYENSRLLINEKNQAIAAVSEKFGQIVAENNNLEIPSLGIVAPLVGGENTDVDILENQLDSGVVIYPESALPGEIGQTIILGHSAPSNWPKIKYDWVFSDINELDVGDKIILHFNRKLFSYSVKNKNIIQKGQEIKSEASADGKLLVLISCWPPGKNYQRIAVEAEFKEN